MAGNKNCTWSMGAKLQGVRKSQSLVHANREMMGTHDITFKFLDWFDNVDIEQFFDKDGTNQVDDTKRN